MPKAADKLKIYKDNFKKNKPAQSKTALMLLACLAIGFFGGFLGSRYDGLHPASATIQKQYISSEGDLISNIASDVGQSVVSINVKSKVVTQDFFGFGQSSDQESAGTGFIISSSGVVVTNRHVVPKGSTSVSITLSDGTKLDSVDVIGRTNDTDSLDIAFLKIKDSKGKKLVAVKLGDSSKTKVGDRVIAIGNALGQFQNTVTSGIISGYGRDLVAGDGTGSDESLTNLFQTDAAINQGNSGGPLVNSNGEVIGINTAVAGGQAQNLGFSIPMNDIKGIITSVLDTGKLEKPYLGVRYVSLTDDYAYQYNLATKRGAYILPAQAGDPASIISGSPADKAGLKQKDIITKINDINIDEKTSLTSALGRFKVGDSVTLSIVRDGKTQEIKLKLEAQPTN